MEGSGASGTRATLPELLVVVVTYRSADVIEDCLRSLSTGVGGAAATRIVVVDNGSDDGTPERVRSSCPEAELVQLGANRGFAAGINAGVTAGLTAGTAGVLILNADVRLGPGSVAPLLAAGSDARVGIVAPVLRGVDGAVHFSLRRRTTLLRALGEAVLGGDRAGRFPVLGEIETRADAYRRRSAADWVTGAAIYVTRRCLEAVGPWDESYFLYSEETDYCLRAADAGFGVVLEPGSEAVHLGGDSNVDPRLWSLLVRNRIRLHRRRHGALSGAVLALVVAFSEAVRALSGRPTSRAGLRALVRRRSALVADLAGPPPPGVVCFSAQDWWYFSHGHSDIQLMTRLAADRPVLFVNSLGLRMPRPGSSSAPLSRILRKIRSAARGLATPVPDLPDFHVLTPFFLPLYGQGVAASLNRWSVRAQVRLALWRLGIRRPDVVVTLPTAWPIAEGLQRRRTVAYRSDRYSALPEADTSTVLALEHDLLAAADAACFSSLPLLEDEAPLTGRPVLLRHGIDTGVFDPAAHAEPHPDVVAVPGPRMGFVGTIDAYTIDLELLELLADRCPDATLVLVGRIDTWVDDLLARPNVRYLGEVSFEDVPSVMAGLDVGLMPWQDNEWIAHCNPVKLKEYLAMGLPVVSTTFPEVEPYRDVVGVAADAESFVAAVRDAVRGDGVGTPLSRRQAVGGETWDEQLRILRDVLTGGPGPVAAGGPGSPCVAS